MEAYSLAIFHPKKLVWLQVAPLCAMGYEQECAKRWVTDDVGRGPERWGRWRLERIAASASPGYHAQLFEIANFPVISGTTICFQDPRIRNTGNDIFR